MRDPGLYDPPQSEMIVASIAKRLGYTCAGWRETLALATSVPANLDYYSTDSRFLLPRRWGQTQGTHIKGDFWRGGESPFSPITVRLLVPLSEGWETELLEEMLATPEGWRALGVGFPDCGRLVHHSTCARTGVPERQLKTFASLLSRQQLPDEPPLPNEALIRCRDGVPEIALDPAPSDKFRWLAPAASWVQRDQWAPIPDRALESFPAELTAVGLDSAPLAAITLRRHPCEGAQPEPIPDPDPPTPDPQPVPAPDPEPEPQPEPDPAPDGRPSPEERSEELIRTIHYLLRPESDLGQLVRHFLAMLIAWKRRSE